MAKRKTRGKTWLAECLSFCQVLLGPEHNKEMDWQVEKEDREASMIDLLFAAKALAPTHSGSQYIKESKIYYTICTDIFHKIQMTSFVFLWLNKSIKSSYVPRQVMRAYSTHTHRLLHQRSGIYQIPHCNYVQCWKNALPLCCEMNAMLFLQG